jgi:hypothetical protein
MKTVAGFTKKGGVFTETRTVEERPLPKREVFTIMPSIKQNISFFGAKHDAILFVTEEGEFQWCENPDDAILALEAAGTNKPIAALLRRLRDYAYSV